MYNHLKFYKYKNKSKKKLQKFITYVQNCIGEIEFETILLIN
jgi:hypothetical protein